MASKKGKTQSKGRSESRGDISMWEMAIGREIDWQGGRNLPDSNLYMPKIEAPLPTSSALVRPLTVIALPPMVVEEQKEIPAKGMPPMVVEEQKETPAKGKPKLADKKGKGKDKDKNKKKKAQTQYSDTNLLRFSTRDELLSWACDGKLDDAIGFTCDHDIILVGFLLFGPSLFVRGDYYIRARVVDDKQNVMKGSQMDVTVDANPRDRYYSVPFKKPLNIEKLRLYTLIVNIRGEPSFQGSNGNHTVHLDDMTFKFVDSEWSQNGTNVQGGQIPGLIINTE